MTTSQIDNLVQEFDELLGKKPYFTLTQLIELGLFGSSAAAATALKRGILPCIKMGPKRTVIPRSAVLGFFKENLMQGTRNEA